LAHTNTHPAPNLKQSDVQPQSPQIILLNTPENKVTFKLGICRMQFVNSSHKRFLFLFSVQETECKKYLPYPPLPSLLPYISKIQVTILCIISLVFVGRSAIITYNNTNTAGKIFSPPFPFRTLHPLTPLIHFTTRLPHSSQPLTSPYSPKLLTLSLL
jgi:hypothetical protein